MAKLPTASTSLCQSAALSDAGEGEQAQQLTQQPPLRSHSSGDPGRMVSASSMVSMRYSRDINLMSVPQSRDLSHELMSAGHSPLTHDSGFLADSPDPLDVTASRLMSRTGASAAATRIVLPTAGASDALRQRGLGGRNEAASTLASHALDPSQFHSPRANTEAATHSDSIPQGPSIAALRDNLTSEFCSPSGPSSVSASHNRQGMYRNEMPPHRSQAVRATPGTHSGTITPEYSGREMAPVQHQHTAPVMQHSLESVHRSAPTPAPSLATAVPALASAHQLQSQSSANIFQSRDFESLRMASKASGSLVTIPITTVPQSHAHETQQQAPGRGTSSQPSAMPERSQEPGSTTQMHAGVEIAARGEPHRPAVNNAASSQTPRPAIPPPPLPCVRTRPQTRTPSPLPPRRAANRASGTRGATSSHASSRHSGHAASTATAADAQKRRRQGASSYGQDTSAPFQPERSSRSHCRQGEATTSQSPRPHVRRSPAPSPPVRPRWALAFSAPRSQPSNQPHQPVQTNANAASTSTSATSRYNTPRCSLPSARRSTSCSPSSTPGSDPRSPAKPGAPGVQVPAGTYTPRTSRSSRGTQHTAPGNNAFGSAVHKMNKRRVSTPRSPTKGGCPPSQIPTAATALRLPRCSSEGPEALADHMTASSAAKRTPRPKTRSGSSYSTPRGHSVPRNMAHGQSVPRHTPREQPVRPLWGVGGGVKRTSGVKTARDRVPGASTTEAQGTADAKGHFSPGTFRVPKHGSMPDISDPISQQYSITPTRSVQSVGRYPAMQSGGSTGTFSFPVDMSAQGSSRELRAARQHWYDANFGDWEKPSRRSTAELGAAAEGSFLSRCSTANSAFSATSSSSGWPWPGYAVGSGEPVPAPTEQYSASFRHHAVRGPPSSDYGDDSGAVHRPRSFSEIRNKFHVASVKEAATAQEVHMVGFGSLDGRRTVSAPSNAAHAMLESLSSGSNHTRFTGSQNKADAMAAKWKEERWNPAFWGGFSARGLEYATDLTGSFNGPGTQGEPRPRWMANRYRRAGSESLPPNVQGRLGRRTRRDRQKRILYVLPTFLEASPSTEDETPLIDPVNGAESEDHKASTVSMQEHHTSDHIQNKTSRPLGVQSKCLSFLGAARKQQRPLHSVAKHEAGEKCSKMNGTQPNQASRHNTRRNSTSSAGREEPETKVARYGTSTDCKEATWNSVKSCSGACHRRACGPGQNSSSSKPETGRQQKSGTGTPSGVSSRSGTRSYTSHGSHAASGVEFTVASGVSGPIGQSSSNSSKSASSIDIFLADITDRPITMPPRRSLSSTTEHVPMKKKGEIRRRDIDRVCVFTAANHKPHSAPQKLREGWFRKNEVKVGSEKQDTPTSSSEENAGPRPASPLFEAATKAQKDRIDKAFDILLNHGIFEQGGHRENPQPQMPALSVSHESLPQIQTSSRDRSASPRTATKASPGVDTVSSDEGRSVQHRGQFSPGLSLSSSCKLPVHASGAEQSDAQHYSIYDHRVMPRQTLTQASSPLSITAAVTAADRPGAVVQEDQAHCEGPEADTTQGWDIDYEHFNSQFTCASTPCTHRRQTRRGWPGALWIAIQHLAHSRPSCAEEGQERTPGHEMKSHTNPIDISLVTEQAMRLVEDPEMEEMQESVEHRHIVAPGVATEQSGHSWISNETFSRDTSPIQSPLAHRISISSQSSSPVRFSVCPSPAHDLLQEQSSMTEAATVGLEQDLAATTPPGSPVPASPCLSAGASSVSSAPESTHARLRAALGSPGPGGTRIPPSVLTTPSSSFSDARGIQRVMSAEAMAPQEPGLWYHTSHYSVGHGHNAFSIEPEVHDTASSAVHGQQQSEVYTAGATGEGIEEGHMSLDLDDVLLHMRQPAAHVARSRLHNVIVERRLGRPVSQMDFRARAEGTDASQGSAENSSNEGLEDAVLSWRHLAQMGFDRGGIAALRATRVALYGRAVSAVKRRRACRPTLASSRPCAFRNADGLTESLFAEGQVWEDEYEASIRQHKALQIAQDHWSTAGMPACCATSDEYRQEFVKFCPEQHRLTTKGSVSLKLLNAAALLQQPSMALEMIQEGYDVSQTDCRGQTALHNAASLNNSKVLCALIDVGAEVDTTDETGCSALHIATLF